MNNAITGAVNFFKEDKRRLLLLAAAVLGILLVLLSGLGGEGGGSEGITLSEYKRTLEGELEELCTSVRGVGRCRVTVTFSEGESLQYKGNSLIGSTPPRVMGVTVVCEGADRDSVREAISECMCSLFDIRSNRVCVLKMK
ncbi:MAG: hypothetical protein IKD45_01495 [Clostridia bacterium]|nr:hypothetical protein [Clostridia bacterium]